MVEQERLGVCGRLQINMRRWGKGKETHQKRGNGSSSNCCSGSNECGCSVALVIEDFSTSSSAVQFCISSNSCGKRLYALLVLWIQLHYSFWFIFFTLLMVSQPLRLIIKNHLYCSSRAFISLTGPEFQFKVVLQLKSG